MVEATYGWNTPIGYLIGWRENLIVSYGLFFLTLLALGSILRLILSLLPRKINPSRFIPETAFMVLLGICIGLVVRFAHIRERIDSQFSTLDSDIFFYILLPPIVFDGVYFLEKRYFFSYFKLIGFMSLVGTILFAFFMGLMLYAFSFIPIFPNLRRYSILHFLLLASAWAPTDPMATLGVLQGIPIPTIVSIFIAGPAILNDGIAVVLFETFSSLDEQRHSPDSATIATLVGWAIVKFIYVFFGSIFVGSGIALFFTLLARLSYRKIILEVIFLFCSAFCSYMLAKSLLMSGVLAILMNGLLCSRYFEMNVTQNNHRIIKALIRTLGSVSDTIIFIYLGLDLTNRHLVFYWDLILFAILFAYIANFSGIFGLMTIRNWFVKEEYRINFSKQYIIAFGCIRGAVTYALALRIPHEANEDPLYAALVTATLLIVLITIFVNGSAIRPQSIALGLHKKRSSLKEKLNFLRHYYHGTQHLINKCDDLLASSDINTRQLTRNRIESLLMEMSSFWKENIDCFESDTLTHKNAKQCNQFFASTLRKDPSFLANWIIECNALFQYLSDHLYEEKVIRFPTPLSIHLESMLQQLQWLHLLQLGDPCDQKISIRLSKAIHNHTALEYLHLILLTNCLHSLQHYMVYSPLWKEESIQLMKTVLVHMNSAIQSQINIYDRALGFAGNVFTVAWCNKPSNKRKLYEKLLNGIDWFIHKIDSLIIKIFVRPLNHDERICIKSFQVLQQIAREYSHAITTSPNQHVKELERLHAMALSCLGRTFVNYKVNIDRIFDTMQELESTETLQHIILRGLLEREFLGESITMPYHENVSNHYGTGSYNLDNFWTLNREHTQHYGTSENDLNEGPGYAILMKLLLRRENANWFRVCKTKPVEEDFYHELVRYHGLLKKE